MTVTRMAHHSPKNVFSFVSHRHAHWQPCAPMAFVSQFIGCNFSYKRSPAIQQRMQTIAIAIAIAPQRSHRVTCREELWCCTDGAQFRDGNPSGKHRKWSRLSIQRNNKPHPFQESDECKKTTTVTEPHLASRSAMHVIRAILLAVYSPTSRLLQGASLVSCPAHIWLVRRLELAWLAGHSWK